MIKRDITIINKLGLHARAASKLVSVANQYPCSVHIDKAGQRVDAKSIMGVMMLAASQGTEITLEIEGSEKENCIEAIITLINNRFDEDQ
ncbi:MAG: HPr family phosphocarrier protein [Gammaproteobacteria bacterium]|nr:HPr family phosphocarrier protein [Gammaproteobacteria bacterium]